MSLVNLFGDVDHTHDADEDFERFWRAYPRRIGKGAARSAFTKALKRIDADSLVASAQRFALHPESVPGKPDSVPHPSTWLNQMRWDDEPVETTPQRAEGARIPAPRVTCGDCTDGWLWNADDTVTRCPCSD